MIRVAPGLVDHQANDDFGSNRVLEENEALLRAALGEDFAPVARAINDFDFAIALEGLKKSVARHGITL